MGIDCIVKNLASILTPIFKQNQKCTKDYSCCKKIIYGLVLDSTTFRLEYEDDLRARVLSAENTHFQNFRPKNLKCVLGKETRILRKPPENVVEMHSKPTKTNSVSSLRGTENQSKRVPLI